MQMVKWFSKGLKIKSDHYPAVQFLIKSEGVKIIIDDIAVIPQFAEI